MLLPLRSFFNHSFQKRMLLGTSTQGVKGARTSCCLVIEVSFDCSVIVLVILNLLLLLAQKLRVFMDARH